MLYIKQNSFVMSKGMNDISLQTNSKDGEEILPDGNVGP